MMDFIKVLQFTDTHLYGNTNKCLKDINTHHSLSACLAHSNRHHPIDITLMTGDIAHDGESNAYQLYNQLTTDLNSKILTIPGNHDALETMNAIIHPEQLQDCYQCQSWCFIMLNSVVPGQVHGSLATTELQKLEGLLEQHSHLNIMICLHHHPVSVSSEWLDQHMLDNPEPFFNLLGNYNKIRAIVYGHIHQNIESQINGIKLFGTPSTCVQFKPEVLEFAIDTKRPAYRLFKLYTNGDINSEVVYVDIPIT